MQRSKLIRWLSLFLGIAMLGFGVLKFVDPFKAWYTLQVTSSGLGDTAYSMGILGEITAGIFYLLSLFKRRIPSPYGFYTAALASVLVIIMMVTGIYVHLHPAVSAEVLPLKIKPPYIPALFMMMAVMQLWLIKLVYSGQITKHRHLPANRMTIQ